MRMLRYSLLSLYISSGVAQTFNYDALQYVDQLIGSANWGDIFPGATLPYGMAKCVPDVDSPDNQGGFTTEGGNVTGFSCMHDSGTGGSPSLGNFPHFPFTRCPGDDINRCAYLKDDRKTGYVNSSIKASPGYFGIQLDNGISSEMTVTQHASLRRFTFPATDSNGDAPKPLILVELGDLSNSRQGNATITALYNGTIQGNAVFSPSFGEGQYKLYFCSNFKGATIRDVGIFANNRATTQITSFTYAAGFSGYPVPAGAFMRFENLPMDRTITVRHATSFISEEQACQHAESEIPDFNFDQVKTAATKAWSEKLKPIRVSRNRVSTDLLVNFYSGIYRVFPNPQDYTGENPLWTSSEPYFDSFYCIWDTFRTQMPFLSIIDPAAVTRIVRALIDIYRHDGWLPDCRMSLCRGFTQGGSNADVILADAYVKGFRDGINWEDGYAALVQDAEVEPYDWLVRGRGGLDSWKTRSYIPQLDMDFAGMGLFTRSISRTLEYGYNDYVICQVAHHLGKHDDARKYLARSENWKNLFKADQTSNMFSGANTGFVGFPQPKYPNGTWGYQNPLTCSNLDTSGALCSLQIGASETYETSIWEQAFYVPHNQAALITAMGGPRKYVDRLNYLHDKQIIYIGNEPSFLTVFLYHFAGRPALSAKRAHSYIPKYFRTTHDGLPGNDDSGAMGSFVAMTMMGLFPVAGQPYYLIIPPFFEEVEITNPLRGKVIPRFSERAEITNTVTGKTSKIINKNFDPSYKNIYIQSATLNGVPYTKNWIDHSFFLEGKELVLVLGSSESDWGTKVKDLPPSVSDYTGFNQSYVAPHSVR